MFNLILLWEFRVIDFVICFIEEGKFFEEEYMKVYMYWIVVDELKLFQVFFKLNVEWDFLIYLRDLGCEMVKDWLDWYFDDIGYWLIIDLCQEFG